MPARRRAHLTDPADATTDVQSVSATSGGAPIDMPVGGVLEGTALGPNAMVWYEFLTVGTATVKLAREGADDGPLVAAGDLVGPFYANGDIPKQLIDSAGPTACTLIVWIGE